MKCGLCSREIEERSDTLYCRYCKTVFHRGCIIEHFYYNRFCPSCNREITFVDMRYGKPPQPLEPVREMQHSVAEQGYLPQYTQKYVPRSIRKPDWPSQEVQFFTVYPDVHVGYRRRPERGVATRVKKFIIGKPDESAGILGRFRQTRKGMLGMYMLIAAICISFLAPHLILYNPVSYLAEEQEYVNHPPTWQYPFGTDVFGRDIYSQTIWGFRSALMVALPSALIIGVIGTVVGLVSGYYGKYVDAVLQRVSLSFMVWPSVPLVALFVFSWGGEKAQLAVIAGVAFSLWPTSARAIRAEVMSLKTRAFIESAKISGASSMRIVFRHILPNVIHITFLYMTIAVASALMLEATFNFLGLSSPAVITWGQMLSFAYHSATARYGMGGFINWWVVLPPGLAIAYMVFSFFLISTGLRESMKVTSVRL